MKTKNIWPLVLSLGLCSGTILVDSFFITVPDWLAIGIAILAIISLITFFISNKKRAK